MRKVLDTGAVVWHNYYVGFQREGLEMNSELPLRISRSELRILLDLLQKAKTERAAWEKRVAEVEDILLAIDDKKITVDWS